MTVTLIHVIPFVAILLGTPFLIWLVGRLRAPYDQVQVENQLLIYRLEAEQNQKERDAQAEEASKKREELQIVYDVARSLGGTTNVAETNKIVLSMIFRLRVPYLSYLLFVVQADGSLELVASESGHSPDLHHPLLLKAVREQRATLIEDIGPSSQQILPEEQSVLLVPLRLRNESVGLVYLGSRHASTHRPEHLEKMRALAALAAPSFKTAMLFERQVELLESERHIRAAVEAKNHQLDELQKLGAAIGTSLNLEDTLSAVSQSLRQLIGKAQSVIFLVANDESLLRVAHAVSPYEDYLEGLALRADEGILGLANASGEAVLLGQTRPEQQNLINNERCVILAALRAEGKTLGFLYLGAVRAHEFGEEQRQIVTTVAYQTALAVNNARLYARTEQLATTDGLTGLYLHRSFQERLAEEVALAESQNKSLCLVMVDTDHFKTYNDTLGHPAGDTLLREIAALLKDKVEQKDIVCRYGGDEFAIILRDVPKEEAARTCERIRETFHLRFAKVGVQVTASIGLACYPSDAHNKAELAEVADQALYVSKRAGRNRVTVAPALP